MIIKRIEKAGDVFLRVMRSDELREVIAGDAGEVDRKKKPMGIGIMMEGCLETAERTGRRLEIWELLEAGGRILSFVSDGEMNLRGELGEEVASAIEEGLVADFQGSFVFPHAGGFTAGEDEGFELDIFHHREC